MLPELRTRFTRGDTIDLFGTGKSENISLKSFWQGSKDDVPGSAKTADRLAPAGYNMT
jgi:hypothetical protein